MNYNFDSIAGYETEKEELKRLCEIFNNRETYKSKGAKLPKGIIFYGEAGTGKTLFSKVMASECGLKVFKIDLGDVEDESMICRHIKKTFVKAAKYKNPTMVFFDEMDKVLPNDTEEYYTDRSKTILTQLLTLIDGMDSSDNIVFVATCNNYGVLPSTLTRPGRMDKKIGIGLPNYASRIALLEMYMKKSLCRFETETKEIAKLCAGFSCAAIETLVNECLFHSDENGFINEQVIYERILEIKNEDIPRASSSMEDTIFACRNLGAFIVGRTVHNGSYVLNLDINSVCSDFFNGVISDFDDDYEYDGDDEYDDESDEYDDCDDDDENNGSECAYFDKNTLLKTITVLLGGYAAEEIILGKTYDNLSNYLSIIDDILFSIAKHGMLGLDLRYSRMRNEQLPYTAQRLEKLNNVFDEIIHNCYEQAKIIIQNNQTLLKKLIPYLMQEQIVQSEECERLLAEWGGVQA